MLPAIAVIGAGTMGEALIKGLRRQDLIDPQNIIAADPWAERLDYLRETCTDQIATSNGEAARKAKIIFLSVKPRSHGVRRWKTFVRPSPPTCSCSRLRRIVPVSKIRRGIGIDSIIRAMPNTPADRSGDHGLDGDS